MAYPAGVITRPVTFGPAFELEDGDVAGMTVSFKATRPGLLWRATGQPAVSVAITRNADDGVEQTISLPVTDQTGWGDGDGNEILPGDDGHVFLYAVSVVFTQNGRTIPGVQPRSKVVPIPQGDLSPLDLDDLIPMTSPGGTVVAVPDIWSAQIAAAKAAALEAAGALIDSASFVANEVESGPAAAVVSAKIQQGVEDATDGTFSKLRDAYDLRRIGLAGADLARRFAGQSAIDYADATETTVDLSTLTGSDNANVSVSGNKLYGSSTNPPIAYWPFGIPNGAKAHAAGSFVFRSGATGTHAFYAGVETSDVGTAPATNTPEGFGIGHQMGNLAGFRGSNQGSIPDGPAGSGGALVDGKTYEWSITIDETWISLAIRAADMSINPYGFRISRASLASAGKTIKRLFLYVQDNRGSAGGSYANPFAWVRSQQPVRTKTIAGAAVEGAHHQDVIIKSPLVDNWRIQIPAGYDPRRPAPVVLYFHQSLIGTTTAQDRPWSDTRDKSVQEALAGAGYIFASASDQGDRWGNQASLDNYLSLYDYLRKHYATSSVVLWGVSMGGLPALNLLAQRKIPNVAAMIGVGPVCDLDVLYANPTYTADIKTAYGVNAGGTDYDAKTAGFNPIDREGWEFRGTPMRFYTGPSDAIVPNASNATPLLAKVGPYTSEAVNVVASGGHLDASQYQPSDVLTFLAKYV